MHLKSTALEQTTDNGDEAKIPKDSSFKGFDASSGNAVLFS